MPSTRLALLAALSVTTALVGGCGTATPSTPVGARTSPTAAPTTSTTSGVFPVAIGRTGGIAGVSERLVVEADGSTTASTRQGPQAPCRLTAEALRRLEQAVVALAAPPTSSPATSPVVADQFLTTVSAPVTGTAVPVPEGATGSVAVIGELLDGLHGTTSPLCPPG